MKTIQKIFIGLGGYLLFLAEYWFFTRYLTHPEWESVALIIAVCILGLTSGVIISLEDN